MTPPAAAALIVDAPCFDRVIRIAGVIVRRENLDPMAVRIAQVQISGMRNAMPARPSLDPVGLAECPQHITNVKKLLALLHVEREMMQSRTVARRHRNIMHIVLAEQPGGIGCSCIILDLLGQPESETVVVTRQGSYVGGKDIDVIESQESR